MSLQIHISGGKKIKRKKVKSNVKEVIKMYVWKNEFSQLKNKLLKLKNAKIENCTK